MENMIHDWAQISANTIEALKIMGMGLLAIFIVIGIIAIAVYILNAVDKKIADKKNAPAPVPAVTANKTIPANTSISKTVPTKVEETKEEEPLRRSELGESQYRKTGDTDIPSRYRKNDDEE